MYEIKKCLFLLSFLAGLRIFGAAQPFYYTHYQQFDERAGYRIFEEPDFLTQDNNGLLWIGSDNGLYSFDGTHFKNYRHHRTEASSLPANRVFYNYQDQKGTYWTAVPGHGLYQFDALTGSFNRFRYNNEKTFDIHRLGIFRPMETRSGALWFPLFNFGMVRYDRQRNIMVPYRICPQGSCGSYYDASGITFLAEDPEDGTIWAASNNGLVHLDPVSGRFTVYRDNTPLHDAQLKRDVYTHLFFDPQGYLWMGSWGMGIKRFDRRTKTFASYRWAKELSGTKNICTGVYGYTEQQLWVGTLDAGLLLFDTHTGQFQPVRKNGNDRDAIIARKMLQNKAGVLWMADDKNLTRIAPAENLFAYHSLEGLLPTHSAAQNVHAFVRHGQYLYLGVLHQGFLAEYHLKDRSFQKFALFADSSGSVFCLAKNTAHNIWIGTSAGLLLFDPVSKKWAQPKFRGSNVLAQNIYAILTDGDGTVWLGTASGLMHYDPREKRVETFNHHPPRFAALPDNRYFTHTYTLYRDVAGNIWFGNAVAGLGCYRKKTGRIYWFNKTRNKQYPEGSCSSISEAADGSILFNIEGVGLGVLQHPFTPKENIVVRTADDGLPSDEITRVYQDSDGKNWLFTTNGICWYDARSGRLRRFGAEDGVIVNMVYSKPYQDDAGQMYLGHARSFQVFDPHQLLSGEKDSGKIRLASLQVNGMEWPSDPNQLSSLQLDYLQNNMAFSFTLLTPRHATGFKYAYKLDGLDKRWNNSGNKTTGQYNNLSAGRYRLRIQAWNDNQTRLIHEWRLPVFIIPPWYATWWFYLTLAVLAATMLYGLYRYRIGQLLQVQEMRTRIASDLHDEIGATLTSISFNSEMIKLQLRNNPDAVHVLLDKMGSNARNAVNAMSDIVWVVNPANDAWENLESRIRNHALDQCGDRGIGCNFTTEGTALAVLNMLQRKNIYLIFKEALHNALKYSCGNTININLAHNSSGLLLVVQDNGKGFDPSASKGVANGLESMARRAAEIGAALTIATAPGRGTKVMLELKTT